MNSDVDYNTTLKSLLNSFWFFNSCRLLICSSIYILVQENIIKRFLAIFWGSRVISSYVDSSGGICLWLMILVIDRHYYSYVAYISLSSSFPFVSGGVLPATSSPPHLIDFSTLLCLLSSSSSGPPLLPSSHLSYHSPPISALASLFSSCFPHVTLPLSSVVSHPSSSLRVLSTVDCSSPVSLTSSSALPSLPLTPPFSSCLSSLLLLFFVPSCFRTLAAVVVVVRSSPRFPFRTGMPVSCSWPCPLVFLRSAGPSSPPQLLSTRSFRPVLFDVPPSPSSCLRTLPLLDTQNCPPESVSSPPARCPAFPSGGLCTALPSSLG